MTLVVDTSVVIKWLVDEGDNAAAIPYLGTELIAPELVLIEVGSVAWKKWRKGEMSIEQVEMVTAFVLSFVATLPVRPFAEPALQIALALNHPVYDCYFLATAQHLETKVLTFDARLARACSGTQFEQYVHYLGSAGV